MCFPYSDRKMDRKSRSRTSSTSRSSSFTEGNTTSTERNMKRKVQAEDDDDDRKPEAVETGTNHSAKMKATLTGEDEEMAKLEHRRTMNRIHSQRKRIRRKIELEVLQEQVDDYKARNKKISSENERFEQMLEAANIAIQMIENSKKEKSVAATTSCRRLEQSKQFPSPAAVAPASVAKPAIHTLPLQNNNMSALDKEMLLIQIAQREEQIKQEQVLLGRLKLQLQSNDGQKVQQQQQPSIAINESNLQQLQQKNEQLIQSQLQQLQSIQQSSPSLPSLNLLSSPQGHWQQQLHRALRNNSTTIQSRDQNKMGHLPPTASEVQQPPVSQLQRRILPIERAWTGDQNHLVIQRLLEGRAKHTTYGL